MRHSTMRTMTFERAEHVALEALESPRGQRAIRERPDGSGPPFTILGPMEANAKGLGAECDDMVTGDMLVEVPEMEAEAVAFLIHPSGWTTAILEDATDDGVRWAAVRMFEIED
jgi:hypothetical protein